jgi:hypothetical protein
LGCAHVGTASEQSIERMHFSMRRLLCTYTRSAARLTTLVGGVTLSPKIGRFYTWIRPISLALGSSAVKLASPESCLKPD